MLPIYIKNVDRFAISSTFWGLRITLCVWTDNANDPRRYIDLDTATQQYPVYTIYLNGRSRCLVLNTNLRVAKFQNVRTKRCLRLLCLFYRCSRWRLFPALRRVRQIVLTDATRWHKAHNCLRSPPRVHCVSALWGPRLESRRGRYVTVLRSWTRQEYMQDFGNTNLYPD